MASTTTGITLGFWETTIGKKSVMAVSGVVLSGFVIAPSRRPAAARMRAGLAFEPEIDDAGIAGR